MLRSRHVPKRRLFESRFMKDFFKTARKAVKRIKP